MVSSNLIIYNKVYDNKNPHDFEEATSNNSDQFSNAVDLNYHKSEIKDYELSNRLELDELVKMVGADNVNIDSNINNNFSVAILDTGIFPHSDLTEPYNRIIAFKDFVHEKDSTYDDNGHGTAIAGIIGGNGFSSDGKYKGIAPFVNFVSVKVLDSKCKARASDVAKGINWVIENSEKYNIKVLNISVGIQYDENQFSENQLDEVALAAKKLIKKVYL